MVGFIVIYVFTLIILLKISQEHFCLETRFSLRIVLPRSHSPLLRHEKTSNLEDIYRAVKVTVIYML